MANDLQLRKVVAFGTDGQPVCRRRLNIDPPCRSNIDPGRVADVGTSNCG